MPVFIFAQPASTSRLLLPADGLSDRFTTDLVQDRSGFLWIATYNGLNRYDGYQFLVYNNQQKNPNKISHNFIWRILLSNDGDLVLFNDSWTIDVLDPQTNELVQVNPSHKMAGESLIRNFWQAENGDLYFITENQQGYALFLYKNRDCSLVWEIKEERHFIPLEIDIAGIRFQFIREKDGSFLVADQEKGLFRIADDGRVLRHFTASDFEGMQTWKGYINILEKDYNDRIWVSLENGVPGIYLYNPRTDRFELPSAINQQVPYEKVWKDQQGNIIIADRASEIFKLWLVDPSGQVLDYSSKLQALSAESRLISKDFQSMFFHLSLQGFGITNLKSTPVKAYLGTDLPRGEVGVSMRGMIEDKNGKILISTEHHGWFQLDEQRQDLEKVSFAELEEENLRPPTYCRNLVEDQQGGIWTTSYAKHIGPGLPWGYLLCYNPDDQQIKTFKAPYRTEALCIRKTGKIWMTGEKNLQIFDPSTESFTKYQNKDGSDPMLDLQPFDILENQDGMLWIATNAGLLKIDPENKRSKLLKRTEDGRGPTFSSNHILALHEATDGKLWLGTFGGGINIYDPHTNEVVAYTSQDGLANDNVCGILPDKNGNYWISTYSGLSYFDIQKGSFHNFYTAHGFNHDEFNRFAFLRDRNGLCYFGGMNGFNVFKSENLLQARSKPPFFLSGATYYDQGMKEVVGHSVGLQDLQQIKLPAQNRYLYLQFGIADFRQTELNRFAYFLEGFDPDWNQLGTRNEVIFNNLPSGRYTLHLKGAGYDGQWSEVRQIELVVPQFFYKSMWFYLLCIAIAGGGGIWWIMRLRSQKNRLEAEVRRRTESIRMDKILIEQQANQLKELDQFKTRFYTNLTHEFRTPLTVILGMATKMKTHINAEKLIVKNARNLLRLINQLLDLSKIEAGVMELNSEKGDLVGFVHFIAESFESFAATRNVRLQSHTEIPVFITHFDKDKMRHIVVNLVSNAIKFSKEGGKVLLQTSRKDENILIKVQDNGVGIPADKLPYVFDRFYQADDSATRPGDGTGIGLALVKELVQLMDGQIDIQSQPGWGTIITVTLPMQEATDDGAIIPVQKDQEWLEADLPVVHNIAKEETTIDSDKLHLLVVEDNRDLTAYFETCLEKEYNITFAYDGKQGIEKAFELIPDLVITDVMMPEKDGYEVCQTLKSDIRTSHIPIIILTAKADFDSKMLGLQTGADAFLSKPFEEEELLLRLQKLNELREQLKEKYTSNLQEIKQPSLEDQFLQQLRDCIEASIDDPDFEILHLCRAVHLSHSQVYRKVKALTGKTPSTFIRSIRLQKAKDLLKTTEKSVSEIAWDVGFVSPDHFSKAFKQEYGTSPSAIRK